VLRRRRNWPTIGRIAPIEELDHFGIRLRGARLNLFERFPSERGVCPQQCTKYAQRGKYIGFGIVEVTAINLVESAQILQAALAFAEAIHRAIKKIRIYNRMRPCSQPLRNSCEVMAPQLCFKKREIKLGIESYYGIAALHVGNKDIRNLGKDFSDWPAFAPCLFSSNSMDSRRLFWDFHTRISQPVAPINAIRTHADKRAGHEPILKRIDARCFRIKSDDRTLRP